MARTVARRVGAGCLAWALGLGVAGAVAHPESCPAPTRAAAGAAVVAGVAWLGVNQRPDGRFLYRYDRERQEVVPGYVVTRHAGTLLALEQARALGVPGAGATADRGTRWALDELTSLGADRAALSDDVGATALLTAALVERSHAVRDHRDDQLLGRLGRFLSGAVAEDGAVTATWDLAADRPVIDSRSPFTTGEVLWALARLHAELPGQGFDGSALRVSRYLATRRDDVERRFPPVSDHWASYGFAEMAAWPGRQAPALTGDDLAYAHRQAGLFGLQARFESQRRDHGLVRLTRGERALTSGIGTVGEGLGGIERLAEADARFDVDRGALDRRLACVASLLVSRQSHGGGGRVDGAWFRAGVTQVDDQQHAISALIAALPVLEPGS